MSRFRKIDPRIWNDEKFAGMSDRGKLAMLYLITHPNMTSLGAMRATPPGLAAELGWQAEAFREAFGEALAKGMVEHDDKAHFVGLPNFIRYNAPESPNVVIAWAGSVDLLPECDLRNRTIARARAFATARSKAFAEAFDKAFGKPSPKAMPNKKKEQEQEQETHPSQGEDLSGYSSRPALAVINGREGSR